MFPRPQGGNSKLVTASTYLSEDEQNIFRYACEYVGLKLYNQFVKQSGEKAASFVKCITICVLHVGPTSSFLEYTREWIDRVKRRGFLIQVMRHNYYMFVAIEVAMRDRLTDLRVIFSPVSPWLQLIPRVERRQLLITS